MDDITHIIQGPYKALYKSERNRLVTGAEDTGSRLRTCYLLPSLRENLGYKHVVPLQIEYDQSLELEMSQNIRGITFLRLLCTKQLLPCPYNFSADILCSTVTWFSLAQLSLGDDTGVVYTKTVMSDLHVEQSIGISNLHQVTVLCESIHRFMSERSAATLSSKSWNYLPI